MTIGFNLIHFWKGFLNKVLDHSYKLFDVMYVLSKGDKFSFVHVLSVDFLRAIPGLLDKSKGNIWIIYRVAITILHGKKSL